MKHFICDLENQHILSERKILGDCGFGQALVADLFDVHSVKLYCLVVYCFFYFSTANIMHFF